MPLSRLSKRAAAVVPDEVILINQSGRGDKDIFTIAEALGDTRWRAFLRDKVTVWDREERRHDTLRDVSAPAPAAQKLLLMTHVVVGYPSLDANMAMLEAMQRAEVDVVEFQLPFSEPIADGPVFVTGESARPGSWHALGTLFQVYAACYDCI